MDKLDKAIKDLKENQESRIPWYWLPYGSSGNEYAVVEAVQKSKDSTTYPVAGEKLWWDSERGSYTSVTGNLMEIISWIATLEGEQGRLMCQFIAQAHASFVIYNHDFKKDQPIKEEKETVDIAPSPYHHYITTTPDPFKNKITFPEAYKGDFWKKYEKQMNEENFRKLYYNDWAGIGYALPKDKK